MSMFSVGLRSAGRVSEHTYLGIWADSLSVIRNRHPVAAADARRNLTGLMGF